jgi:hypothetical protein
VTRRRAAGAAALLIGACAVALPTFASAAAAPAPVATAIRIGEHGSFTRVVVDFSRATPTRGEIVASDPDPYPDGSARIPLDGARLGARALRARGHGVSARIGPAGRGIVVRLTSAPRRFKYLGYTVLRRPGRLAIDLWKSAAPGGASGSGPRGCLALASVRATGGAVRATGAERDLFEHGLIVRLRSPAGRIVRERAATAADGRWSVRLRTPRARRQRGTLEAVALSAKDGALVCLVQVPLWFGR